MREERRVDPCLGFQIRRKREKMGKTLAQAAKDIGISPSLLSQIERGIVNPSISTLRAIADYLDTPIGVLLGERVTEDNAFLVRKDERKHSILRGKGVRFYILSPTNSNVEFMYDEFDPGSSTGEKSYKHEGEECVFVLEGRLEITLSDRRFVLEEGDFMWFNSSIPHKIRNISDKKSVAIWVDTPPKF